MSAPSARETLAAALGAGGSTLCRMWLLERRDGLRLGFTDHDRDLTVEGVTYRAGTGLTATALQQSSGLAVDNSEALGALSDAAITEADLAAGRYDGARLRLWLANWQAPEERHEIFAGTLGEVSHRGGAFRAELRGLTEPLNQPTGQVYSRSCPAVLGDARCRFDILRPGYAAEAPLAESPGVGDTLILAGLQGFEDGWFANGRLDALTGAAAGLSGMIRSDRSVAGQRRITLWQSLRAALVPGDLVRLTAGCDKRAETCRQKFDNFLNFRGFPDLPGADWLSAGPRPGG